MYFYIVYNAQNFDSYFSRITSLMVKGTLAENVALILNWFEVTSVLRGVKWLPEWTVKLGVELGTVRTFTLHTKLPTVHAIDIVKYALSLRKSFYDWSTKARIQENKNFKKKFLENNTESTLEIYADLEARYDLYITFLTSRKQFEIIFREHCA